MKNILAKILLPLIVFSCGNEKLPKGEYLESDKVIKQIDSTSTDWMDQTSDHLKTPLGRVMGSEVLILNASLDECGEWGGHHETIKIYRKENQELWLDYTEDQVDCEKISTDDFRTVIKEGSQALSVKDEEKVINYLQQLVKANFAFHTFIHGGSSYSAVMLSEYTSDTSFQSSYQTIGNWEEYQELKKEIIK